jgi:hypothetical protein
MGLFSAKFEKRFKQINESDSDFLVEIHGWVKEIDYSLRANVIIWRYFSNSYHDVFYAIPINKR